MEIDRTTSFIFIGIVAALVISLFVYLDLTFPEYVSVQIPFVNDLIDGQGGNNDGGNNNVLASSVKNFSSADDFKKYLADAEDLYGSAGGIGGVRAGVAMDSTGMESAVAPQATPMEASGKGGGENAASAPAERVSETNVQVEGIDEPDIVKTNGREIFYSNPYSYWYGGGVIKGGIAVPNAAVPESSGPAGSSADIAVVSPSRSSEGVTKIISAFPPEDLALSGELEKGGDLLISGDSLAIFRYDKIYGYDISDPKSPEKKWEMDLEDNNYIVSSRLYNGKIYLVLQKYLDVYNPCPIRPLSLNGTSVDVACADIYHPVQPVPVDTVYTAFIVNPQSGDIEKKVSFTGSSGSSLIYMSDSNLYLTYSYNADIFPVLSGFFIEEMSDIFPSDIINKLKKLQTYDISSQAKLTELQTLTDSFERSLSNDDRLRIENEITNRGDDYFKKHLRELEFTGIAKISLNNFNISANDRVPGMLLNQFSLDEYNGYLRVATTIGGGFWGFSTNSVNDVYVLDGNLKVTGAIKDLGLGERIYSARFLGDLGYLVTFRQTDPFYVLDLSSPKNPELKGELKIPGYSSYLHPISDDKILGIGRDSSKVKISLFDVSSADNPSEIAKYSLNEYWSDILNTHHAFLLDKKHKVFFMPGSSGGYVFSYANDKLKLVKAISNIYPRRAVYLNDYLYVLSDNEVVVLDENTWERVKNLEL